MRQVPFTRRQFAVLTSGALASAAPVELGPDTLAAEFLEPPMSSRPATYWVWLNGLTDNSSLSRELEELKKTGFSAAYILEIGTRAKQVPAGPAYMGPESLKAIAHAVREATRLGMEIGLTNASSWNSGGSWITPEHASKGLYLSRLAVQGPGRISRRLPAPEIPTSAPRRSDGTPSWQATVAVLAVPEMERLPGFDFVFDLVSFYTVDRVVLHNGEQSPAREFVVFASDRDPDMSSFREVFRGTLEARAGAQSFRFAPARAKHLRLRILSGYRPGRVELAEFEAFGPDGEKVTARKMIGGLVQFTAEGGLDNNWRAAAVYDGRTSGPAGSWAADEPPPAIVRDPSAIVDLTDRVDEQGNLVWEAPPGDWSILRFVAANTGQRLVLPSPNSAGFIIDHFSAEASRFQAEYMMKRLHSELPEFRSTALKYFYACSYEVRGSMWTPDFAQEFRRRRGYDLRRFLPVLAGIVIESEDISERFRVDFRRTVAELFTERFYGGTREVVNRHGLKLVAEAGGPGWPLHQVPADALKALATLDVPRGEFWHEGRVWVVKETASAAHLYGGKIVQMESFTSWRHWQDGPYDLKRTADRAFCEGMNQVVWHTMPHVTPQAGRPGWVYHAGTHLQPDDPWWPMAKPFADYLARCSHMLRQGLFAADVCYYYGEQGFNFIPERQVDPSLGFGFDYDVTNSDVILTRMSVRDGRIVLPDGMSYELLVLPDRPDMDLHVLERIERLVRDGATIAGRRPVCATSFQNYPDCDQKVRLLADRLWSRCDGVQVRENVHGKGKVIWGVPLREILAQRGIGPDFAFSGEADLDFIHRRLGNADIYFVRNRKEAWAEARCTFRVKRSAAEIWDPVTGRIYGVQTEPAAGGSRVALRLPPYGSVFVVFRSGKVRPPVKSMRGPVRSLDIAGPWEVSFPPELGAPPSVRLQQLISWTDHPESGVRFFSGIATYRNRFDLPAEMLKAGRRLYLDLGELRFIARVHLNGKPLGVCWTAPFRIEITGAARPGANALEVEIANTWSNRLTGDAQGSGTKYTNTNMPWSRDAPLLRSGLLGPVRVVGEEGEG